jgi:hypothetical protein
VAPVSPCGPGGPWIPSAPGTLKSVINVHTPFSNKYNLP